VDLWIADRGRFGFDAASRDFSERDKLVLEALAPHLVHLHRRARARIASEDGALDVLTPGTVRKHLDNIYAQLGVGSRAAAAALIAKLDA
jgi:ATP/maltotriose-dependent transcriptional regulator MalT